MNPSKQLNSILRIRNQSLHPRVHTSALRKTIARPALIHRMASHTAQPRAGSEADTKATENTGSQSLGQGQEQQTSQSGPLPLPAPTSDTTQLNVNGEGVKLDHLGPLVVNKDGTLSRIANWDKMAEIEKQNTLRILGKRNQLRLGNLRNEGKEGGSQ